jgi:superfamily II DNA or RNA helicase
MQLRQWQAEAITSALTKYRAGQQHFLCLATPGAGKTLMASLVARDLLTAGDVDLVLCFTPSINVASAFQSSLETHIGSRLDGLLGSRGRTLTYQSMLNLDDSFWSLLVQYRVFAIFDEIHHCAGDNIGNGNAWGEKIIQYIQGRAAFTMALTGTPWRSDGIPITLSSYCREGRILCDYSYGLGRAVKDGVCRLPLMTAVDNDQVVVRRSLKEERFSSFGEMLKQSSCSYQQLLTNPILITHMVKLTSRKLKQVREQHANAGALIVAASVEHAHQIADIVRRETGDEVHLATYVHDDAQETITTFRETTDKWIISVGMISEGTDIPRLRVCCHLTRVKTELYFRQVLGRILRTTGHPNEEGYFFMPAEPNLIEFAQRVAEDVPECNAIVLDTVSLDSPTLLVPQDNLPAPRTSDQQEAPKLVLQLSTALGTDDPSSWVRAQTGQNSPSPLSDAYDAAIGLFGRFREHVLSL